MKKLMFALVIAAALLHVPTAKAAYIGTFAAGSSYSLEIAAGINVIVMKARVERILRISSLAACTRTGP